MTDSRPDLVTNATQELLEIAERNRQLVEALQNQDYGPAIAGITAGIVGRTFGQLGMGRLNLDTGHVEPATRPPGLMGTAVAIEATNGESALKGMLSAEHRRVVGELNDALQNAGFDPISDLEDATFAVIVGLPTKGNDMALSFALRKDVENGLSEGKSVEQALSDGINNLGGIGFLGDHSSVDNDATSGIGWVAGPEEDGLSERESNDRDDWHDIGRGLQGSHNCFVAETPVLMADGSQKPIQEVVVGDLVMAFEGLGELEPARVVSRIEAHDANVVEIEGIRVTPAHRFLIQDGTFKPIADFSVSDCLVRADGTIVEAESPVSVPGTQTVYNLTIENLHTYVAGGFRVHNIKVSPVAVDLNGDGVIETIGLNESTTYFDVDSDGYLERVGWVGQNDGFIVADLNNDGDINAPEELALSLLTPENDTDLEALASHFDTNQDGILDGSDSEFSKLRVWQDIDQDGMVDAGELRTLPEAGIVSIDVNQNPGGQWHDITEMSIAELNTWGLTTEYIDTWIDYSDTPIDAGFLPGGNVLFGVTEFARSDGTKGLVGDIALGQSNHGFQLLDTAGQIDISSEDGGVIREITSATGVTLDLHLEGLEGVVGGMGDDQLSTTGSIGVLIDGVGGDDVLTGGAGDDWLIGGDGADTITGGEGDDVIFFRPEDTISGGLGNDTAMVDGTAAVNLNLAAQGIEIVIGNAGADTLDASSTSDGVYIAGGSGNDSITGGAHSDTLIGDAGADTLLGGAGNDSLFIDEDDLNYGLVRGGAGVDTVTASTSVGVTFGLAALEAEVGIGGSGNDNISVDGSFDALLDGAAGDDILEGGDGKDVLIGGTGYDTLRGGYGYDAYLVGQKDGYTIIEEGGAQGSWGTQDRIAFIGLDGFDDIDLWRAGSDLHFSVIAGSSDGQITGQFDTTTANTAVEYLLISDQFVQFDPDADGGSDNDIVVGTGGADLLSGGGGNDVLYGNAGDDTLDGGAGDDWLKGGADADALIGGTGVDTASYVDSDAGVTVDLASGAGSGGDATGDTLSGVENLVGSEFNDNLTGNADANSFIGSAGADAISGAGGVDTVSYARSDSGVTVDLVTGAAIGGIAEGDLLTGIENLVGSDFADTLTGNTNSNVIEGGDGDDNIDGISGDDSIWGGDGSDLIFGNIGNSRLYGGNGEDIVDYSRATDRIWVVSEDFEDTAIGNLWSNPYDVVSSVEQLSGSPFDDTIWFTGAKVFGGGGDDYILTPLNGNNELYGGDGNDKLVGGEITDTLGNDLLNGGKGNDDLRGANGNDIYHFERWDGDDRILDAGGKFYEADGGIDTVSFGAEISPEDILMKEEIRTDPYDAVNGVAAELNNTIIGVGTGHDPNWENISNDIAIQLDWPNYTTPNADHFRVERLQFEDGLVLDISSIRSWHSGTSSGDQLQGGGGSDWIEGLAGDDALLGIAGADILQAGAGNDSLAGGDGNDTLLGGDGADTLIGGAGDDWLRGGYGNDVFSFDGIFGNDVIDDYGNGTDEVKFIGYAASDAALLISGGDTVVDLGSAGSVTLADVIVPSLDEFTFV